MEDSKNCFASLANLISGAAIEAFDIEQEKVFNNILDPNTTFATRTITLTATITPDKKSKNRCDYTVQAKAKLAPAQKIETTIVVGKDRNGRSVARELTNEILDCCQDEPEPPLAMDESNSMALRKIK